ASTAMPPILSTATPTWVAKGSWATTIACRVRTGWRALNSKQKTSARKMASRGISQDYPIFIAQVAPLTASVLLDKHGDQLGIRGSHNIPGDIEIGSASCRAKVGGSR